jgi:aldose 1-epimerase
MIVDSQRAAALTLSQGESRCELLPLLGGSIGAWVVGGQPMLRAASGRALAAKDVYATAGFPLVPYSNRVDAARFEWHGRSVALMPNFEPEPHAIHGVGFERPWEVHEQSENSALLTLKHLADAAWPWDFEARQRITLGTDFLTLSLSATNLERFPVPLAFGHHPYFPRGGARLQFRARSVWLHGEDGLPSERVAPSGDFDFSSGAPVERADIDHCYSGWERVARVIWEDKAQALEISASPELTYAVVYARAELDEFCFEPVPHLSNALNRQEAEWRMPVVSPGESFTASICFRAAPRTRSI